MLKRLMIVFAVCLFVFVAFAWGITKQAMREAKLRKECAETLKQISLALHEYHESHSSLPTIESSEGGCTGSDDVETDTMENVTSESPVTP